MRISVILVNYNGKRYNRSCIQSIFESRCSAEIQVIAVDNHSTDGSVEELLEMARQDMRIEVILQPDNLGFAAANNIGIRKAAADGADYIVLLNNDTFIREDMLEQLLQCARRHEGSVVTPKICYADDRDRIWAAGGRFAGYIRKTVQIGENETDKGQYEEERRVDFSTGCCMFFSAKLPSRIGYLSEAFFLYYEDTEWCFRMREADVPVYYCPAAVIYHKVSASTKGNDNPACAYYIARNWLICSRLHLGRRFPVFLAYFLLNRCAWVCIWGVKGRQDMVRATFRGIGDYHRKITGIYRERR